MKKISRDEMKKIKGAVQAPSASCCSVTCGNEEKRERECGNKITCTTSGTTICCGEDCVDMCSWSL